MHDLAIVGGGPAGMSAALVAGLNDLDVVLLERSDVLGGQLHWADAAIPDLLGGYAESGSKLAERFSEHLRTGTATLRLTTQVEEIHQRDDSCRLHLAAGEQLDARRVLLATGVDHRRLGVPGEHLANVVENPRKNFAQFEDCSVAVVGGGDEASSMAHDLAQHGARVDLLVRADLRARPKFYDAVASQAAVTIRRNTVVAELAGDDTLEAVVLTSGERLTVDYCFIRIGVELSLPAVLPNFETTANGLIQVDDVRRTTCPVLFAAGDLVRPPAQRYIAAALADGTVAARRVEADLAER